MKKKMVCSTTLRPVRGGFACVNSLGGDIFIHAKSSNYSNLWELAQLIVSAMPADAVAKAEDVYGWQYREGRDLSGFIDGEQMVT